MDKAVLRNFAIESRKDLMEKIDRKIKLFYIILLKQIFLWSKFLIKFFFCFKTCFNGVNFFYKLSKSYTENINSSRQEPEIQCRFPKVKKFCS